MKRFSGYLLVIAGFIAGAARWLDLMNFTDLSTGFCTAGSVWLRYGVLVLLLGLAALHSFLAPRRPSLEGRSVPLAGVSLLGGAAFAALGGLSLLAGVLTAREAMQSQGFSALQTASSRFVYLLTQNALTGVVFGVLEFLCAWWLVLTGLGWLDKKGTRPMGEFYAGVLGTFLFYALVLRRFMENSSSFYRIIPTTAIFTSLAALLFTAALLRALFFPESENGRAVYRTGMWAFYLCFCCELPQAVCRWIAGAAETSDLALSFALCCIGALGGAAALRTLGARAEDGKIEKNDAL